MSIPIFIFSSPGPYGDYAYLVYSRGNVDSYDDSYVYFSYGKSFRSPDLSSLGDNSYRVAPSGGYDFNYFVYHSYGKNSLSGPRHCQWRLCTSRTSFW